MCYADCVTKISAQKEAMERWGACGDALAYGQSVLAVGIWEKGPQGYMTFRSRGAGKSWEEAFQAADVAGF